MPTHNGITLGPGSPLLTKQGRRRVLTFTEAQSQMALLALLVGEALPGRPRELGAGMTVKYPELMLLYAINPNKGGQNSKAARGIAKAMGLSPNMPDLCLPVARACFHALYVELKREVGGGSTPDQAFMQNELRRAGNCVLEVHGVEAGAQAILGYLALPRITTFDATRAYELLTPKPETE